MARIPLVPAAPNDGKSYVQSNGSWVETSAGVGIWNINKGYGTNDPVQFTDGVVYKAKQWIPPGTAWDATLWVPVSGSAAGTLGGFVKNKQYLKYESIFENGVLYRARTSFTTGATFAVGDWEAVGSGGDGTIGSYDSNKEYKKNQPIYNNAKIYRAKADFQPALVFDEKDWEVVAENGATVKPWAADTDVITGEMRSINGYRVSSKKTRKTSSAMSVGEFKEWSSAAPQAGWILWSGTVSAPVKTNTEVALTVLSSSSSIFGASDKFDSIYGLVNGVKVSGVDVSWDDIVITTGGFKLLNGMWLEPGDTIVLYFK